MKYSLKTIVIALALGAALFYAREALAQRAPATNNQPVITSARVALSGDRTFGPLYVTIRGKEIKVAEQAIEAWVIQGGHRVVYSGPDGAGGWENEGQSLHSYEAWTGKRRKIMSEYFRVDKVTEVTTSKKKSARLVEMGDGGLGASYVAIVDPARGEVFFRRWAKIISRRGDIISIGHYREEDWDKLNGNENVKVTPYKKERHNLNAILKRRVIYNKRQE